MLSFRRSQAGETVYNFFYGTLKSPFCGYSRSLCARGFQALSAAAERNNPIFYVCLDNEAYMNTGGQGSTSTRLGAHTTTTPTGVAAPLGKCRPKKDLFKILADHEIQYAATARPSYLADFQLKLRKARMASGFRYIHTLCPYPTGWGSQQRKP